MCPLTYSFYDAATGGTLSTNVTTDGTNVYLEA